MKHSNLITFLNPRTCGIYKDGGTRYKTDPSTGTRTDEVDNQLLDHVTAFTANIYPPGAANAPVNEVFDSKILVPTYFDHRYNDGIHEFLNTSGIAGVTLGELIDNATVTERRGHGSPSNDQRVGHIPYIKVSDIRSLRINPNPTNLVSREVAQRFWRGNNSGLEPFDLITPNRASSNIGEFAILLPGEQEIVVTKEVFVFRVAQSNLFDHYYLLWALSLRVVRDQWRRIALMQTNREDCGRRYREIVLPRPQDRAWADKSSAAFREYFTRVAAARTVFARTLADDGHRYTANVAATGTSGATRPPAASVRT